METQTSTSLSLEEIYSDSHLKKLMLKHYVIDLVSYPNLIRFLTEDSICLDEETIQSIEGNFKEKISEIFSEFGSVFVKLNYSAPTDSDFLVYKLECFKLEEILVLLKGSDKLNKNFEIFQKRSDKNLGNLFLILKKFYNIKQENEFRLFILNQEIKGISQRHINIFFNFEKEFLNELKTNIFDFYEKQLKPISNLFSNFMFVDVLYLEKTKKFKIIDIINEDIRTVLDSCREENCENLEDEDYFLLFKNWAEIGKISDFQDNENNLNILRVIPSNDEIIETKENLNKFPLEIIGGENVHNINDILNLLTLNKEEYLEK